MDDLTQEHLVHIGAPVPLGLQARMLELQAKLQREQKRRVPQTEIIRAAIVNFCNLHNI